MNNFTCENTLFVSVGAYQNPTSQCRMFIKTAAKFNVPITWISYGEPWQGFINHKLRTFLENLLQWQQSGTQYVFMLDSRDVVFADDVSVLLQKANAIYTPGTLLFNA